MRELCEVVDLLLVVGSRNSSNSNRLREIGVEQGVPSYLIADGSELDPAWLDGVQTVGLTAGASAPEELVLDVIEALRRHGEVEVEQMDGVAREHRVPPAARARTDEPCRARRPRIGTIGERTMGIPLHQAARIGAYLLRQHLRGPRALSAGADARAAVPLQPGLRRLRQDRLSRRDPRTSGCPTTTAWRAIDECGAPVVSIAGGEPLLHREMPKIVKGFLARKKFVILCTNALLLAKKIDDYQPHPLFTWSIHLDGNRAMHDKSVCQQGVYDKAVEAIRLAKSKGFRVSINCTLFNDADPARGGGLPRRHEGARAGRHHRVARLCL